MNTKQFLFIGLIGVALTSVSYASFSNAIQQYWRTTSCATGEIKQGGEIECYTNGTGTPVFVGEAVQSGTVCEVAFSHTSQRFFCRNGVWQDYGDVHIHRRKRFLWFIAAAIGAVLCAIFCGGEDGGGGGGGGGGHTNQAPTIICPKVEPVYYAPPRETSVLVSWPFPTAKDSEQGALRPKLVSGYPSGSYFEKNARPTYYRVTDNQGASATCSIKINVVVHRCEKDFPNHPLNGNMTCTPYQNDPVLGTTCTFTCKEGYQLSNSSSSLRTCQENGLFDGEEAICSKIECADLDEPNNGEKHCTNGAFYNSVCSANCSDNGFESYGNITRCQSDGQWTVSLPSCQDILAPYFTFCPVNPVRAYADKGKSSATVSWESPTAADNSGNVTVVQMLGKESGSTFDVGTHLISYMSHDSSGNDSPESCIFDVVVEYLQCDSPDGKFDDELILAECPGTEYTYGTTCNVSCIRNYDIIGNTTITCERESPESTKMIWDWGGGSQPTCKDECPPLRPPANGGFLCQTSGNMYCRLTCDVEFGYPSGTSKDELFICTDQQLWYPPEADDCEERRPPDANLIGADLHYFVGDCNDASVQENLKDKFLAFMVELVEIGWSNRCPIDSGCIRDTIGVTCGPVTSRRKRDTMVQYTGRWRPSIQNKDFSSRVKRTVSHVLTLSFTIEISWVGGTTADDLQQNDQELYNIVTAIENEIASGGGNISYNGVTPEQITADRWPMMECPFGQTAKYYGDIPNCEGCATGKYYEATISNCAKCPVGTYQNETHQTTCKACPIDMSTKETGRKNVSECFPMCPAGRYSATGVIPCTECNVGEYQPKENSKSCHKCDVGKTTIGRGQISDSTCTSYDVVLSSPGYDVPFPNLATTQEAVTLMFWLECPLGNSTRPTFGFVNGDTFMEILRTVDGETLKLLNRTMVDVTFINGWKHIAVVLSKASKQAELMINGNSVWNATIDMENIAVSGSYLVMGQIHGNNSNCRISGLKMTNTSKSAADLQTDITTCTPNVEDAIYTMDNFKNTKGIEIDTPSKCDEIDECDSSPCGVHFCENLLNGYRCECTGGYMGDNCEIAPDYCVNHQCENGATCISGEWNYTCTCSVGFKGTLCEDNIVDGNWAEWGIYTECSQTCNGGTKTRIRTCSNPPPGPDGVDCSGNSQDQTDCNTEPCQECDPIGLLLLKSRNTKKDVCYYEGDYTRCKITCETGLDFVNAPRDFYECGANTSYQWNGIPPSCAASIPGRRLTIRTSVTYPSLLPCVTETDLALASAAGEAQCIRNNACTTSVSTTGCSSRRKRDTDTTAEISFFINLEDLQDFNLTALLEHNVVSADLQTYINAIAELEQTAQEINNSVSDFFAVNINNVTYNIDPETFAMSGVITCPNGSIPNDGACVECPVGTSEDNGWCVFCDLGTYQDQEGQTECLTCPTGYTTQFVGMIDVTNCSEPTSTSTTEDVTTSTSTTEDVTTSTSATEDVTTSTSTAGDITTSTSATEDITTSTSTTGDITTSTSTTKYTRTTNGNVHPPSIGTGTSVEVETTAATTKNNNSKKSEESAMTVLSIVLSLTAVSVIILSVTVVVYFKTRRYVRKRVASSESLRRQGSSVSINMIHPTFSTKIEGCVPFPDYSPMPNHHPLQTKMQMEMSKSNHKTMHITKHN